MPAAEPQATVEQPLLEEAHNIFEAGAPEDPHCGRALVVAVYRHRLKIGSRSPMLTQSKNWSAPYVG